MKIVMHTAFTTKFNISSGFPFTLYYGILASIPIQWKVDVGPAVGPNRNIQSLIAFTANPRPTRLVYNHFVNNKSLPPIAIAKWEQLNSRTYNWDDIFRLSFFPVRDAKIKYFQYRCVHMIVGSDSYLFKIKKRDSPLCSFATLRIKH